MKCKNCEIKDAVKYSKYSNGKFCSRKCACAFSTKEKRKEINEKVSKTLTGRKYKIYFCKYCSIEIEKGMLCDSCKKWSRYKSFYKKMNIYDKLMTYEEMNKSSIQILVDLYFNKHWSGPEIEKKFNINSNTLNQFFKKNHIKLRTLSDSLKNALLNGKSFGGGSPNYKHGWHITWENKHIYYRSSYELNYAKWLDDKKIPYEVEFKRILYYDNIKNEWRIAIPDFYLPLENKIIEIKSKWSYDEQNMNDKVEEYKKQGYDFELLLEDDRCINNGSMA